MRSISEIVFGWRQGRGGGGGEGAQCFVQPSAVIVLHNNYLQSFVVVI